MLNFVTVNTKAKEMFTERHSKTSQKVGIYSNIAAITSEFASVNNGFKTHFLANENNINGCNK